MQGLRRIRYGAWVGILVILMTAFAPMVSQTLLADKFQSGRQANLAALIQATPHCTFHDAIAAENVADTSADASTTAINPDHEHLPQHDSQEACGYCKLFAHSPFLLNTLLHIDAATITHHAYMAAIGAAFRPYTVAAASRPQPPPLT
jgi:hypothetical protein